MKNTSGKQGKGFSVVILLGQLLPVGSKCVVMKKKKETKINHKH